MGMLTGGFYNVGGTGSWEVTLSGETGINDSDTTAAFDARSGIRVRTDGTIEKYKHNTPGAGYTQIDATTDWIIPNTAANSNFEVNLTVTSGNPALGDTYGSGVWHDLSTDRVWLAQQTTTGVTNWTWTLSIRYDGGATIDSATYSGQVAAGL